jgi:hypothetical protein
VLDISSIKKQNQIVVLNFFFCLWVCWATPCRARWYLSIFFSGLLGEACLRVLAGQKKKTSVMESNVARF